jgi:hypothetical protein
MAYYINSETGEMIDLPKTKKYIIDKFGNGRTINNNIDYTQDSNPITIIGITYIDNEYQITSSGIEDIKINEMSLLKGKSVTLIDGDNIFANCLKLIFRNENEIQSENLDNYRLKISNDTLNAITIKNPVNSKLTLTNNRRQIVEDYDYAEIDNFKTEIIKNNIINSLLRMDILRIGNNLRIYYEIDEKVSLYDYIKSNQFKDYQTPIILFNIIMNLESIREYLLDYKDLSFEIQDIFISKDNLEIKHILSHNKKEAETKEDIYLSLITLVNIFNDLKPNNYLCPERSNILLMLNKNDTCLEEVSRAIINEEIQNKVDDSITNQRVEFRIKEQESNNGDESDKKEFKFLNDINPNKIKNKIFLKRISKSKAIIAGQIILLIILGVIYVNSFLNTFDFIAALIIVSALDLWVLKINKFL